jgi:hypothetical protein
MSNRIHKRARKREEHASTWTVNDEVAELPAASEAVHTTVEVPRAKVLPDACTQVTVTVPLTRSEAVGAVYDTTAPAAEVASTHGMLDGVLRMVGGVLSHTVTVKLDVAELPFESVVLHVTVVVPRGNVEPDGSTQATVTEPSTKSVAVGLVYVTTRPAAEVASWHGMSDGVPVMVGGVLSHTSTMKEEEAELPAVSTAVHTTVEVPRGNTLPDPFTHITVTEPLTTSVAVGMVKVITAPSALVASTHGMLDGVLLMVGGVRSHT